MLGAPLARVAALDGIRAVAVVAVLAYHLDERALPGGFLGVDVFFVLSGFLITSLLLQEWEDRGTVDLGTFWRRRARRLIPPLVVLVLAVALVTPAMYEELADRIRGELLAAFAQSSNWFEALAGRSYFDELGRPSPLRHLWSLGVEAQFYAVWPLLGVMVLRRAGTRLLGWLAIALAGASFLAMALVFAPGHDPSRLYYGTDTRIGTLLVGAVLAVFWPGRLRWSIMPRPTASVDVAGVVALLGLTLLAFRLDGTSAAAYRGGLLLAAVLAAVLVSAAVHPGSRIGRVLAWPPLVWLGTRSYAVYLWHWPVILATRPGVDVDIHGWTLLALRLGLTVGLAEVSTRGVERVLQVRWRAGRFASRRLVAASAVVLAAAVGVVSTAPAQTSVVFVSPTTALPAVTSTTVPATLPPTTAAPTTTPPTVAPTTTVAPAPPAPINAVAVGESVLLSAGGEVQRVLGAGTVIDAEVARQPDRVLDALEARRNAGHLQGLGALVVQMGTNGEVKPAHLERLAALVEGVPRVVAVTVYVDRPWAEPGNATLRGGAARWPWLRLADWHEAARQHPEWLGPDGVHPNQEGARNYAELVAGAARAP